MAPDSQQERWREFGAWVKQRRLELGLAIVDAARLADLSPSTWSTIEAGGRVKAGEWVTPTTSDRTLARMAQALQLPPAHVFEAAARPANPALWERHTDAANTERPRAKINALHAKIDRLSPEAQAVIEAMANQLLGED